MGKLEAVTDLFVMHKQYAEHEPIWVTEYHYFQLCLDDFCIDMSDLFSSSERNMSSSVPTLGLIYLT